jgi:ElaB/YqjD/DUF883 family membrane-anchored ribosome-binding protein
MPKQAVSKAKLTKEAQKLLQDVLKFNEDTAQQSLQLRKVLNQQVKLLQTQVAQVQQLLVTTGKSIQQAKDTFVKNTQRLVRDLVS